MDHDSTYNTPPVYGIYIVGLVAKWLLAQGGAGSYGGPQCQKEQDRL